VFPLNALIVRENLADGASEEKEVALEFGLKLILYYIRKLFLYYNLFYFSPIFYKG